jgi:phosphonate transport system substrate-binding protein
MTRLSLITQSLLTLCLLGFLFVPVSYGAEYTISMLPRYSTGEINKRVTALAKYLSEETGLTVTPRLTSSFDEYLKQLKSGGIDIGFQNPYIYVLVSDEQEVIAMAEKGRDGDKFRGIIITPANSPLRTLEDLKHKKIGIVGLTSAGGYLSQKLSMLQKNIDVAKECSLEEAQENKQENVIFAVYTGDVDAGFIRESALDQVDEMIPPGAIKVMASTAWLPNWPLSVNRKMPASDREKIVKALDELTSDSPVLKTLKIKGIRPAKDSEYDTVRIAAGLIQMDAASQEAASE